MKMKINISEFINDCELSKGEIIKYLGISRSTSMHYIKERQQVFNLKLFKNFVFYSIVHQMTYSQIIANQKRIIPNYQKKNSLKMHTLVLEKL